MIRTVSSCAVKELLSFGVTLSPTKILLCWRCAFFSLNLKFVLVKETAQAGPVFEIRENNHCVGVIFQAGKPKSMLKNPPLQ